jgi:hypothetical protein
MKLEEINTKLALTPEEIADLNGWFSNVAGTTKIPLTQITEFFESRTEESIAAIGLENVTKEQFLEFVKSAVMSDAQLVLPPPPGVHIITAPLGWFPTKSRNLGPNKIEKMSEIIAYSMMEGTPLTTTSMMAFGDEATLIRNDIDPMHIYDTVVSFNAEKKQQGFIKCSIHKETKFNGNQIQAPGFPANIKAMEKYVLSQYPTVPLGKASTNISKLIHTTKGQGSSAKTSKPFPDSTDLKVIQVRITDFISGIRKDNIEWGKFSVVDSTFIPTINHKSFNVWVDPMLARRVGAGKDSFVRMIGTLQHDQNQQFIEMNCCAIIVDRLVPLVETVANMSGIPIGPVTNVPTATTKVLSTVI